MFTCLTADWLATADELLAAVACCDCWEELPEAAEVVAATDPAAAPEVDPPEPAADCNGGGGCGAGAAASFLGLWGPAVSCGVLEGSTRTMIAILVPFWELGGRKERSLVAFGGRFARRLLIPRVAALQIGCRCFL